MHRWEQEEWMNEGHCYDLWMLDGGCLAKEIRS